MRKALSAAAALAIVAASPVLAQTTPPATPPTVPGTVLQPNAANAPPPKVEPAAPLAGANSFTESQAKARIEAKGFSNVSGLKKDEGSIWRGTAMKDGKPVTVALDYQGNVVAN